MRAILLGVVTIALVVFNVTSAAAACDSPSNVGFRVVKVDNTNVGVWYPTSDGETNFKYADKLQGRVAANGGVERCTRFPLVVFSHGFGGCGIQSVFLTEALARHGYIVAAPDHKDALVCTVTGKGSFHAAKTDESFLDPGKWTDRTHTDRRDDLKRVITWMLGSPMFRDAIAPGSVGAVGHSLGGYAVLGLAGGWESWHDDRIGAVLVLSPYAMPFLKDRRLQSIRVPVMYQGAQFDLGITPFLQGANGAFSLSNRPKYYVELRLGNHFIWTNLECGNKSVGQCADSDPTARLINDYGIAFLDRYLKGSPEALSRLDGNGLASFQPAP